MVFPNRIPPSGPFSTPEPPETLSEYDMGIVSGLVEIDFNDGESRLRTFVMGSDTELSLASAECGYYQLRVLNPDGFNLTWPDAVDIAQPEDNTFYNLFYSNVSLSFWIQSTSSAKEVV